MSRSIQGPFLVLLFLLLSVPSFAGQAAKVVFLKGKVDVMSNNRLRPLAQGNWVNEGDVVQTSKASVVKLIFIDKSTVQLGPKSSMAIQQFPRSKAGILNLFQGKMRAKVTKNYMEMDDKTKSKLFIKTGSAAMGIRGTEFQVTYDRKTKMTGLVTYSGRVKMIKLEEKLNVNAIGQEGLDEILNQDSAVMVGAGEMSFALKGLKNVTPVKKLSPAELQKMVDQEESLKLDQKELDKLAESDPQAEKDGEDLKEKLKNDSKNPEVRQRIAALKEKAVASDFEFADMPLPDEDSLEELKTEEIRRKNFREEKNQEEIAKDKKDLEKLEKAKKRAQLRLENETLSVSEKKKLQKKIRSQSRKIKNKKGKLAARRKRRGGQRGNQIGSRRGKTMAFARNKKTTLAPLAKKKSYQVSKKLADLNNSTLSLTKANLEMKKNDDINYFDKDKDNGISGNSVFDQATSAAEDAARKAAMEAGNEYEMKESDKKVGSSDFSGGFSKTSSSSSTSSSGSKTVVRKTMDGVKNISTSGTSGTSDSTELSAKEIIKKCVYDYKKKHPLDPKAPLSEYLLREQEAQAECATAADQPTEEAPAA